MPSVFVLMPFDDEFNSVYSGFLEDVLRAKGFEVTRADNIENQRSIMKDVIEGIVKSDLIVADLTSSNPNVYYELGIAHALGKPVIHLTQALEEVPFDLRAYRFIEYSTHFDQIGKARGLLDSHALRFLEGKLKVGNPVTDYHSDNPGASPSADNVPDDGGASPSADNVPDDGGASPSADNVPDDGGASPSADNVPDDGGASPSADNVPDDGGASPSADNVSDDAGERGFLDHLIDVTEGYEHLTRITEGVMSELQGMSESVGKSTEDIQRVTANPNQSTPSAVRSICRRLADRIGTFNGVLKPANTEYEKIAQDTEDSLEFVVSFQREQSDVMDPKVAEEIESLKQLQASAIEARDSCIGLASSMDGLPRLERRLNRELDIGSAEITYMARNLDKISASISRALNKYI